VFLFPFIYYYYTVYKYTKARGIYIMAFDFSNVIRSAAGTVSTAASKAGGTVFELLNPSNARLNIAGLLPGGRSSSPKEAPNIGFQSAGGQGGATALAEDDWRVRISLADKSNIFYKDPAGMSIDSMMTPLIDTNGVIFPYTPTITIGHTANYNTQSLTHSNYPAQFYTGSEVNEITISGEFTVQSPEEGQYLLASVYFFRAATKMFFGQGSNVGNPPPIVFLDGYGSHYLPHVPCVITNFTHQLSSDVDYINIPVATSVLEDVALAPPNANIGSVQNAENVPSLLRSGRQVPENVNPALVSQPRTQQFKRMESSTRVPTSSTISITLRTVYSRANLHDRFDLEKFAQGQLLSDRDKGYGGFL
jgi:hypothetical protein